jgi:hypothetical protein
LAFLPVVVVVGISLNSGGTGVPSIVIGNLEEHAKRIQERIFEPMYKGFQRGEY